MQLHCRHKTGSSFFFQAKDGIRDKLVTGVQTCALPIFGAAYTYQIVNKTLGAIDPFVPDNRARNYNSAGRRPHAFTVHYSYSVPNIARTAHPAWRAIVNDWQISGVTTALSGAYGGFSYVYSNV